MTFVFAVGMPWDATTCNAIPSRISRSHQCLAAMSPTPARPANLTSICWLPTSAPNFGRSPRSEEHTSELQSLRHLVCRLLLVKKNPKTLAQRFLSCALCHPPGQSQSTHVSLRNLT